MRKLAMFLLVLMCVACAEYAGPDVGQVEKRTFYPFHVETGMMSIPVSCGNGCTSFVFVPYSNDIPDAWYLTISGCEDPAKPKTCKRGSFEVTHEMYDSVEIGLTVEYEAVRKK